MITGISTIDIRYCNKLRHWSVLLVETLIHCPTALKWKSFKFKKAPPQQTIKITQQCWDEYIELLFKLRRHRGTNNSRHAEHTKRHWTTCVGSLGFNLILYFFKSMGIYTWTVFSEIRQTQTIYFAFNWYQVSKYSANPAEPLNFRLYCQSFY